MIRAAARALAWVGWALLAATALAGLALSAAALLALVPFARTGVASAVVRIVDDALAGGVELAGIEVLPGGALELRELRVLDPDGRLVLAVGRARLSVDVTALRARRIGLEVELDAPSVLLDEDERGVSLARAFAPARRSADPVERDRGGSPWTVHVSRLQIRDGDVWWVDAAGETRLEAGALDVSARGTLGPGRARAEVRLRGALREPVASPIALDLVLARRDDALRLPVLRLEAGGTELAAVGEGDLARRRGRLAVTGLGIARDQARALVPAAPDGADLRAVGYADADGETVTVALHVEPEAERGRAGAADAALAARLGALVRGAGFDVALDRLDPAKLSAAAPAGEITLVARGAVSGTSLDDARARLALTLSRSRLRRGEVTRAEVQLRAARGTVEVDRLTATAPGATLAASGRWRRQGAVGGTATADVHDVAAATRNLSLILGEPAPALGGRVRLAAELSGTSAAPALTGTVESPGFRTSSVGADGIRLAVRLAGPLRAPDGQIEGRIAHLREGGRELARQISLRAALQGEEGTLSATGAVPGTGSEPLGIDARGRLGARRETLHLAQLALAWPGARWTLARPAIVDLRGPSVDRLELESAPQRIAVSGGIGARRALAARVELSQVDLARLPPGVLPPEAKLGGQLTATIEATGKVDRPVADARVELANGAAGGLTGLAANGSARWDGVARRAIVTLLASRAAGGSVDVALDVPLPVGERARETLSARVRASALPIAELLAAAELAAPVDGVLAADVRLAGTAGAPTLAAELTVAGGAWEDLDGLGATVTAEGDGGRLRVLGSGTLSGRRVLALDGDAPLELAELLAHPADAVRALERAPLRASVIVAALDVSQLAGRVGIPAGVTGIVTGRVELSGAATSPRGGATFDVTGAAWKGWRRLGGHVELAARDDGVAATGTITTAGLEALRFDASLGVPPDRIPRRDALLAAPLRVDAVIPTVALAPAAGEALPLSGTVEGRAAVTGSLRRPIVGAELSGTGVAIEGRPLGDARASVRYALRRAEAEAHLRPSSGGTLRAALAVEADLGVGADGPPLGDAPATASVVAEALDLGFLPALAPATIRSAGGQLAVDVRAKGPLARMSPRGTLRVSKGRLAVAELGEWTDVALEARVTDDVVELARLEVRRGSGRLSATGALRGARSESARLTARASADGFTIARAGMDIATFDMEAEATGTLRGNALAVEVAVPRGVVRLPKKSPRALQSLERRKDIVVGRKPPRKAPATAAVAAAGSGAAAAPDPFSLRAHVVAPKGLFVKSENPRVDIELKADVRYELAGDEEYAEGSIEVVRGAVEPIAGRTFTIDRGRVQFTGGPPRAALLDVEAKYVNPAAVVTVNLSGAATAPEIRLTSQPPMDETQIAMLIATGRTELKAGSGAVGSLTGEEAGKAALGALATQAFRNLVQDKLPLDTVALDSGTLRAGKYVTDKIYVGYVRRFDADPTKNENADEVRVEYQITPRWMFESRYGNAQSGGASLIWSRDY